LAASDGEGEAIARPLCVANAHVQHLGVFVKAAHDAGDARQFITAQKNFPLRGDTMQAAMLHKAKRHALGIAGDELENKVHANSCPLHPPDR
jgi:hypothetical protein